MYGPLHDGRCKIVRYRQKQLESLHNELRDKSFVLCKAATQDSHGTGISVEIKAEFCMAMDAVRHFYENVDFEIELKRILSQQ